MSKKDMFRQNHTEIFKHIETELHISATWIRSLKNSASLQITLS